MISWDAFCFGTLIEVHHIVLTFAFAAARHTSLDAVEGAPPLEIEEREEHHRKANVDGDYHGPRWNVIFDSFESHFIVIEFEGTAGLADRLASCDYPNLIRTLEHDLLVAIGFLHILRRYYFRYEFWLIFPKVWPVIAKHEYLTIVRHFINVNTQLDSVHHSPHIRHSGNRSLLVHELHDARTCRIFEALLLCIVCYIHKRRCIPVIRFLHPVE